MARHKYTLMMKDEYGHWTMMPHGSSVNSKKEIVDCLERTFSFNGASKIRNIDRGDILDVEVTWQNLFGETIQKTFSYKWEHTDGAMTYDN
jgi:hypothetical protein